MTRSFWKKQNHFTGFQPGILLKSLRRLPAYWRDICRYRNMKPPSAFRLHFRNAFPILTDMNAKAGVLGGHYFHQDLWAARKIFERRPGSHFDIGSRIDGFVAHLLVFMPVTVVDVRPIGSSLHGLVFHQDDASELLQIASDSIDSISTLHVAEHFGLGRYKDPVDPTACFKFMNTLQRVVARGGRLYFSVPVGRERVEFNAHRIFAPQTILSTFSALKLVSFSFVGDDGNLYENTDPLTLPASEMACGLFEFTKE